MRRIKIDKEKCVACHNCVYACMAHHNTKGTAVYDLDLTDRANEGRNTVIIDQFGKSFSLICRHCELPECVNTCMSGAMIKDDKTGFVMRDANKCASCYMCVMACKFGVLKIDKVSNKNILKCDMCEDKDTPACVENCPTKSLEIVEV